jgi:transglutaminase-like putative cysteine protease
MPIFSVRHLTEYRYKKPVRFGEHRLLFRPRDSYDQRLLEATLVVEPEPANIRWMHDVFGNCVAIIRISRKSPVLRFETEIRLDHTSDPIEFKIEDQARTYPFVYDREEMSDLKPTMKRHYPDKGDEIGRWARQFLRPGTSTDTGRLLMTMCYAIRESFVYARRSEQGTQPPLTTLQTRKGTCRDFALLMMEAARSLGLAARFVSGYVYVPDRDGSTIRGGGSTHAWCQIYLPGAGWVEFDPTNGIVGNRDLIRVAVARDPSQAVPLSGSYSGRAADFDDMTVQVNVTTQADDGKMQDNEPAGVERSAAQGV